MTPKSQAKIKPQFPQYQVLTIKKFSCELIYILCLNHTMRIYSNVYDFAIYLKLLLR